jgi:hypothetical protein
MKQVKILCWLASLCWAAGSILSPAHAEIGVVISDNGDETERTVISYTLRVLDDPDPVGSPLWILYNHGIESRILLNPGGHQNGDGPPSIAQSSSGGFPIVAWSRNSPAGYDVVVSAFRGGVWSEPEVIADSSSDELDPALVVDSLTGAVHLLYWVSDPEARVMIRTASADLASWSAPTRVSLLGESAKRPTGVMHVDELRVIYESQFPDGAGESRELVLATQTAVGFVTEAVTSINLDELAGPSRPVINAIGQRLWVEWIDSVGDIAWTTRVADGPWEGSNHENFSDMEERDYAIPQRIRAAIRALIP